MPVTTRGMKKQAAGAGGNQIAQPVQPVQPVQPTADADTTAARPITGIPLNQLRAFQGPADIKSGEQWKCPFCERSSGVDKWKRHICMHIFVCHWPGCSAVFNNVKCHKVIAKHVYKDHFKFGNRNPKSGCSWGACTGGKFSREDQAYLHVMKHMLDGDSAVAQAQGVAVPAAPMAPMAPMVPMVPMAPMAPMVVQTQAAAAGQAETGAQAVEETNGEGEVEPQ